MLLQSMIGKLSIGRLYGPSLRIFAKRSYGNKSAKQHLIANTALLLVYGRAT